jgi:hypothetical protein
LLLTPEAASEAGGLCWDGRMARSRGAGHNIRREQFGPYMEAVRAFLGEMDQR